MQSTARLPTGTGAEAGSRPVADHAPPGVCELQVGRRSELSGDELTLVPRRSRPATTLVADRTPPGVWSAAGRPADRTSSPVHSQGRSGCAQGRGHTGQRIAVRSADPACRWVCSRPGAFGPQRAAARPSAGVAGANHLPRRRGRGRANGGSVLRVGSAGGRAAPDPHRFVVAAKRSSAELAADQVPSGVGRAAGRAPRFAKRSGPTGHLMRVHRRACGRPGSLGCQAGRGQSRAIAFDVSGGRLQVVQWQTRCLRVSWRVTEVLA